MAEDRRVRRTRKLLRDKLIEKLKTTELSKITVKELCEAADINRSTFYLHHDNVYSLWQSIEDEIIFSMTGILSTFDAADILTEPLPLLLKVTESIEEDGIFTKELFQCRESIVLLDKIKLCFIDYFISKTEKILVSGGRVKMEMYSIFVISGTVSLFYQWFLGELKISLRELAFAAEKLITGGVNEYIDEIISSGEQP